MFGVGVQKLKQIRKHLGLQKSFCVCFLSQLRAALDFANCFYLLGANLLGGGGAIKLPQQILRNVLNQF